MSQISTGYLDLVEVSSDRTASLAFASADGSANFRSGCEAPRLQLARNGPMSAPSRYAAAVPSR